MKTIWIYIFVAWTVTLTCLYSREFNVKVTYKVTGDWKYKSVDSDGLIALWRFKPELIILDGTGGTEGFWWCHNDQFPMYFEGGVTNRHWKTSLRRVRGK